VRWAQGMAVKRLRPLDRALLFILVPLWGCWFALYLNNLSRGRVGFLPIVVSVPENPNDYPRVRGFWGEPWGNLKIGDHLVRIGGENLRGVWPVGFFARAFKETEAAHRVPVVFMRAGRRYESVLSRRPDPFPWEAIPITVSSVAIAVLLLLRKPGSRLARTIFLDSMAVSFLFTPFNAGSPALTYAWAVISFVCTLVQFPLALKALFLFPEEDTPAATSLPAWPWLFAVAGPIWNGWMFGVSPAGLAYAGLVLDVVFLIAFLVIVTHRFLLADPIGRRQVKWVLYGTYIALVPVLVIEVLVFLRPTVWMLLASVRIFLVFIPLSVFIAIVRFNLFDIDRVISATAAYTIMSVLVIAGALAAVPWLFQTASRMARLDPGVEQLIVPLLLAAVVVPGSHYLRPQIEKYFFVERYALERGVQNILRELSACNGPRRVLTLVGERLDFLIRPESCVVYGLAGETYAPLFYRGRAVPPPIEAGGALVTAFQAEAAPVEVERWLQASQIFLRPFDRAVLASLGAEVLMPVRCRNSLCSFLSLGRKRSGDIYTTTDLALLDGVAQKVSAELQRFEEEEIVRQSRAMQEALRRYVPDRIAAHIVSGQTLEATEREVSVLFVDLRGYTTYAEDRSAEEVFSVVNRYTEAVSTEVRTHGGTVVEFNGDGMMSVFGAPEPLADKEWAAVAAGREIVRAVRSLALGPTTGDQRYLEVGVGIATGKAFVGNIRSVDRLIWSAIGNTSNLAARLQGLTRELDAAIVIDAATWTAARDVVAGFERHGRMPIRGRRQTEDIYALPLACVRGPTQQPE
jgi:class 3 adenylate cyclase